MSNVEGKIKIRKRKSSPKYHLLTSTKHTTFLDDIRNRILTILLLIVSHQLYVYVVAQYGGVSLRRT